MISNLLILEVKDHGTISPRNICSYVFFYKFLITNDNKHVKAVHNIYDYLKFTMMISSSSSANDTLALEFLRMEARNVIKRMP
jgi:hypothetical protein